MRIWTRLDKEQKSLLGRTLIDVGKVALGGWFLNVVVAGKPVEGRSFWLCVGVFSGLLVLGLRLNRAEKGG